MYAYYAHLQKNVQVVVGDQILAGDLLGYVGITGNSSGPHLHYAVKKGTNQGNWQDPRDYLPKY